LRSDDPADLTICGKTRKMMSYEPIDTTDIDRWMGKEVGGEQLREPVTRSDVFRWAQAMRNPNPAYYDRDWVEANNGGAFRMPQSYILACTIRHGTHTSMQGEIVGGRQMNGGDEWWFEVPVQPGDIVTSQRRALDYTLKETGFAGPTLFQRGETIYVNQHGTRLARQVSTSIRFLAANLKGGGGGGTKEGADLPVFSAEEIAAFEQERLDYARSLHQPAPLSRSAMQPGLALPVRPIGPHSVQSFTCEQRAFLYTIWGNLSDDGLPRTARNIRAADGVLDPEFIDGLYHGASAGHTDSKAAGQRGMPRAYGAGATACAWMIDYVTNWAGAEGEITHCKVQYRNPILVGDLTYISGEVTAVHDLPEGGCEVDLSLKTVNQKGQPGTTGNATVRLSA
jgi:acyl dehydratase